MRVSPTILPAGLFLRKCNLGEDAAVFIFFINAVRKHDITVCHSSPFLS